MRSFLICFYLLLYHITYLFGQEIPLQKPNAFYYWVDSTNNKTATEVSQQAFTIKQWHKKDSFLPTNYTFWIKISMENKLELDTSVVFYPGFQNYVFAYLKKGDQYEKYASCGNLVAKSELSLKDYRQALLLNVKANSSADFLISTKNVTNYQVDKFEPKLITKTALIGYQEVLYKKSQYRIIYFFMGMGMFFIMLLYIFLKWIYQKDSAYFYYALSIFGSSFFFLFNFFESENNQFWFSENPIYVLLIADSFIFLSIFAYWGFVRKFLYLDKEKSFLNKFLFYCQIVIAVIAIASLIYALVTKNIMGLIAFNSKIALLFLLAGCYVLYAIRNSNQPLRRFIYGGIISIIFFSTLASVYEMLRSSQYEFMPELGGGTPLIMVGFIVEMLFFTTGLAYRNMLENKALAKIEYEKNKAELKALRAQMNPHFIFNCMNTIDAYIFKEEPEKASKFLNRFSKLIRETLQNSSEETVNLSRELEALMLYIKLEQERFDYSFDFEITDYESLKHYKLPPLILQPYVENAILHGLRNLKNNRGFLKIELLEEANENLKIMITDNGIGRKAAQKLKGESSEKHNGVALNITESRLNKISKNGIIKISDLNADTDIGTIVTILLPKITD